MEKCEMAVYDTPEKRARINAPLKEAQATPICASLMADGHTIPPGTNAFLNALYKLRWTFEVQTGLALIFDYHDRETNGAIDDMVDGVFFRLEPEAAYTHTKSMRTATDRGLIVRLVPYLEECSDRDLVASFSNIVQVDSIKTLVPEAYAAFEAVGGFTNFSTEPSDDYLIQVLLRTFTLIALATTHDDVQTEIKRLFDGIPPPCTEEEIHAVWGIQAAVYKETGLTMAVSFFRRFYDDSPEKPAEGYAFELRHTAVYEPSQAFLEAMQLGVETRNAYYVTQ